MAPPRLWNALWPHSALPLTLSALPRPSSPTYLARVLGAVPTLTTLDWVPCLPSKPPADTLSASAPAMSLSRACSTSLLMLVTSASVVKSSSCTATSSRSPSQVCTVLATTLTDGMVSGSKLTGLVKARGEEVAIRTDTCREPPLLCWLILNGEDNCLGIARDGTATENGRIILHPALRSFEAAAWFTNKRCAMLQLVWTDYQSSFC
mmetsp:Transcript_10311/g.22148  ORF Transcript_10311/g.22148 Transcript_10311/m.22148 type:complete len:207 (+) Transcript_10311:1504-2124(+)